MTKKVQPGRQPRIMTPAIWSTWTVAQMRGALDEHERGWFQTSALLAEQMFRDDRISAAIDQRVLGCLGLPYCTEPSDSTTNTQAAERMAARVEARWFEVIPEAVLADLQRWAIPMGFAIGELTWNAYGSGSSLERWPSLHVHHPQFSRYDFSLGRFVLATPGGMEVVEPGDGRWVLYAPMGASRPWMHGAVRPLATPWMMRSLGRRDWARRMEIDGIGVRKAYVPRTGGATSSAAIDKFLTQVSNLGSETTLRLIRGANDAESFDFDIAATDMNASTAFAQLIGHCDTAITLAILGQNLTTEVEKGGSYAAAGVHARVLLDRLEADVAMLSTTCREQIIKPWGRMNVEGWDDAWAPWPKWDATPPEDQQKRAAALASLAQALPPLQAAGVDVGPMLERFGLELAKEPPAPPPPKEPSSSPGSTGPAS